MAQKAFQKSGTVPYVWMSVFEISGFENLKKVLTQHFPVIFLIFKRRFLVILYASLPICGKTMFGQKLIKKKSWEQGTRVHSKIT